MKKIILFIFLLLMSVLMFGEEYTIVSFNIQYKNNKENNRIFQNALRYLVDKNDADIVLLQEVYIGDKKSDKEKVEKFFTENLSGNWEMYTTFGCLSVSEEDQQEAKKEPKNTQHNAILFDRSKFKTVEYLNNYYSTQRNDENDMCKSTFNNVQAVKISTRDEKIFFVVNAHVSPHGNFTFNSDTKHRRDFNRLTDFIQELAEGDIQYQNVPVILGGDINFTTVDLKRFFNSKKTSSGKTDIRWIVDGSESDLISQPWVTTLNGGNPYDHFIFNINYSYKDYDFIIKKVSVSGYSKKYSMRHAFENKENVGVILKSGGPYVEFSDYTDYVSDHLPICITIETK